LITHLIILYFKMIHSEDGATPLLSPAQRYLPSHSSSYRTIPSVPLPACISFGGLTNVNRLATPRRLCTELAGVGEKWLRLKPRTLIPFLPSPIPCRPLPLPFLRIRPLKLNTARDLGSAVRFPSRVWGEASAESEFSAF